MVTSWQANFPGLAGAAERLAAAIVAASGGRLRIEVFPGNELVAQQTEGTDFITVLKRR